MNPHCSVSKVSGCGAKNKNPVDKLCKKVDKTKSRRLCFCQEEGSTCLQEQIAQTGLVSNGWELGLGGGAEQVIKGEQVGPSELHFLQGSGVSICLLLSHPVVLDICLTRKQVRKAMLLKLYVSGDPCTEAFVLKLNRSEEIHYIFILKGLQVRQSMCSDC